MFESMNLERPCFPSSLLCTTLDLSGGKLKCEIGNRIGRNSVWNCCMQTGIRYQSVKLLFHMHFLFIL